MVPTMMIFFTFYEETFFMENCVYNLHLFQYLYKSNRISVCLSVCVCVCLCVYLLTNMIYSEASIKSREGLYSFYGRASTHSNTITPGKKFCKPEFKVKNRLPSPFPLPITQVPLEAYIKLKLLGPSILI